jgi:hypothetical protein
MKKYQVNSEYKEKKIKNHTIASGIFFLSGSILFSFRVFNEFKELGLFLFILIVVAIFLFFYMGWRYWQNILIKNVSCTYEIADSQLQIKYEAAPTLTYDFKSITNISIKDGKIHFEYQNKRIFIENQIDNIEDFVNELKSRCH